MGVIKKHVLEMDSNQMYKADIVIINDKVEVKHPTVDDIIEYGESKFFSLISTLCGTPTDYKLLLHRSGQDWNTYDNFRLFCGLITSYGLEDTKVLFGDKVDFSKLQYAVDTNEDLVLAEEGIWLNPETNKMDILYTPIISRGDYNLLVDYLRDLYGMTAKHEYAGNKRAKEIAIEIEEELYERNKNSEEKYKPWLWSSISFLVNQAGFKYNYEECLELKIGVFMEAMKRNHHLLNIDNLNLGIYTGNIDSKKIKQKELDYTIRL